MEYKVTIAVASDLSPDEIRRIVQTGLQDVLSIERILVGPPRQKHRAQLRRTEDGALEFRMVERPVEEPASDSGGRS